MPFALPVTRMCVETLPQPGNGATDHGELALVASEDLADLDQYRFDGDRGSLDLHARHVAEQVANCIHGASLQNFHFFGRFQHVLNIGYSVKSARALWLGRVSACEDGLLS